MHVSYWLLPSPEDGAPLARIIHRLADAHGAARFAPHITLYSGPPQGEPQCLLDEIGAEFRFLFLAAGPLRESSEISKTLFIQFETTVALDALARRIGEAHVGHDYAFDPHLSLLYQALPSAQRKRLTQQTAAPLGQIRFDRIAAVRTNGPLTKSNIENWRLVAEAALTDNQEDMETCPTPSA